MNTAMSLFAEHGFRGTTTKQLAAAAGVTEPVLYYHFRTKLDLYSALLRTKAKQGAHPLETLLAPYAAAGDDLGFFTQLARHILSRYSGDPSFVRLLLYSALEGHQLAELFYQQQISGLRKGAIVAYIRRRIRQGAFRSVDPVTAASTFTGIIHHRALISVLFPDRELARDRDSFVQKAVQLFLHGIRCEVGKSS